MRIAYKFTEGKRDG